MSSKIETELLKTVFSYIQAKQLEDEKKKKTDEWFNAKLEEERKLERNKQLLDFVNQIKTEASEGKIAFETFTTHSDFAECLRKMGFSQITKNEAVIEVTEGRLDNSLCQLVSGWKIVVQLPVKVESKPTRKVVVKEEKPEVVSFTEWDITQIRKINHRLLAKTFNCTAHKTRNTKDPSTYVLALDFDVAPANHKEIIKAAQEIIGQKVPIIIRQKNGKVKPKKGKK